MQGISVIERDSTRKKKYYIIGSRVVNTGRRDWYMWQSQVENEHYSTVTVGRLIQLVISLEYFIETTPDFLCPFMND